MKSKAIEKCWDEVRLVATMACDLRCELEELKDQLHNIWLNGEGEEADDADALESDVDDMAYEVGNIEDTLDEWKDDNKPF